MNPKYILNRVWCCNNNITHKEIQFIEAHPKFRPELSYLENTLNYLNLLHEFLASKYPREQISAWVKVYHPEILFV